MKMNGRKVFGFLIGCLILLIIWFSSIFLYKEILNSIGITIILAIPTLVGLLIGGNAIDKYTISKHYQKDLDKRDQE
jgi:hypothetical protein